MTGRKKELLVQHKEIKIFTERGQIKQLSVEQPAPRTGHPSPGSEKTSEKTLTSFF